LPRKKRKGSGEKEDQRDIPVLLAKKDWYEKEKTGKQKVEMEAKKSTVLQKNDTKSLLSKTRKTGRQVTGVPQPRKKRREGAWCEQLKESEVQP